jgi:hypothetical protein
MDAAVALGHGIGSEARPPLDVAAEDGIARMLLLDGGHMLFGKVEHLWTEAVVVRTVETVEGVENETLWTVARNRVVSVGLPVAP